MKPVGIFLLLFLFLSPAVAQKKKNQRAAKPMVILNTNRSLNAAKARRFLWSQLQVSPSYYDSIDIQHRLRFIELYAEKRTLGNLGANYVTALYDLTDYSLKIREGFRINPKEKNPRMVFRNLKKIDAILHQENLADLDVPFEVHNVYESDLGLYFDLRFQLQDTVIVTRIDHRFDTKKSRIIVYEN